MQDAVDWAERYATQAELDGVDDTDDSLRCDRCGEIETPPYADGDACVCGGTFHPANARIDGQKEA